MKLRSIKFIDHPIIGDLSLDFTVHGKPVDTVIFAGENGTGKSTILNLIMSLSTHDLNLMRYISEMEIEDNGHNEKLVTHWIAKNHLNFKTSNGVEFFYASRDFSERFPFRTIYSDVAINYNVPKISYVTGLELDSKYVTLKSTNDTAREIAQLLIDIDTMDGIEYRDKMEEAREKGQDLNQMHIDLRLDRFSRAFGQMFGHIKWKGVKNVDGSKKVYFEVYDKEVELGDLSSGEKQIIFRGGYLLKNQYASDGALVLIDEPEISMHPEWQKRIMNFYKNIFTNSLGEQFSQIFAVTHSPFIIHNENRYNDKVIVLKKDDDGKTYVEDKPEYYCCNNIMAIEDAFNINDFSSISYSTVFLEGETDELYWRDLVKMFGISITFDMQWIGQKLAKGKCTNTGCSALEKSENVLSLLPIKNMLLYDCDIKKSNHNIGNVIIRVLPQYPNKKNINIGIENALVLDEIDISGFYREKEYTDDTGAKHSNQELDKVKLCEFICALPNEQKKRIYANLKSELDEIIKVL